MNSKRIIATAKLPVLHAIVLACVLLLPSGCLKDLGGEQQKAPVKTEEVILTIANGVTSSAPLANEDNDIASKNIWVLQIEAKGDRRIRYAAKGEAVSATAPLQYRVKLLDSSGGEKWNIIVVVTSSTEDLSSYVGKTFLSFATSKGSVDSANADSGIVGARIGDFPLMGMVVVNGNSDISISRYMAPLSVSVLRAVAKVDIGIGTYNANNDTWSNSGANKIPFTLSTVQLRGSKLKVRWYFNIDADTFDPLANAVKKVSPEGLDDQRIKDITYTSTTKLYIVNLIFMWEFPLSGIRYDDDHLKRPRLIIGGKYGDSTVDTYYRIDFSGLDGGSKDSFTSDILRNHLYRFTINSVSGPGQDSPDEADATIPETLDFTTAIVPWETGVEDTPNQQIGYYMNYEGLNGEITATSQTGPIPVKTRTWKGRQPSNIFDYNTFYGEADNFWGHLPSADPGNWNGDLYATANGEVNPSEYKFAALKTEGAYLTLMIAANNLVNVKGDNTFPWKEGQALTAFDMCRAYNGGGFSDWRLPRLSELALMYANRAALEALSGFEPFGENAVYWSGSEYGVGQILKSSEAWTFTFTTTDTAEVFNKDVKSARHLIRCVRQP